MKEFICITCPKGCHLKIDEETLEVSGNSCSRGAVYAKGELTAPKRTVTTTVALMGGELPRCPVRTTSAVPKEMMIDIIRELKNCTLTSPVKIGQVVSENILGTGVNVIVTRDL